METRIRFSGRFESAELEDEYRRHHLPEDISRVCHAFAIAALAHLAFVVSDYRLFGDEPRFFLVVGIKVAYLLAALGTAVRLRRGVSPRALDQVAMGAMLVTGLMQFYIDSTRPPSYIAHALTDSLLLICCYTFVPAPFFLQLTGAGFLTAGIAILFTWFKAPVDPVTGMALIMAFLLSNVVGAVAAWDLHRWKRTQFTGLKRERGLRKDLEEALGEIRTLRGILSICSFCKRVRSDGGWQQVEVYVRDHTHVEFSHGICPDCAKLHYGSLADPIP